MPIISSQKIWIFENASLSVSIKRISRIEFGIACILQRGLEERSFTFVLLLDEEKMSTEADLIFSHDVRFSGWVILNYYIIHLYIYGLDLDPFIEQMMQEINSPVIRRSITDCNSTAPNSSV